MSVLKTIILICDKCSGSSVDSTSSSHFTTVKQVESYLLRSGWTKKGKKHFCEWCSNELKNITTESVEAVQQLQLNTTRQ